jgi:hypothetical protein
VDAEGAVTGRNSVVELTVRFPPEAVPADVQADLDDIGTRASDAGYQDDATVDLSLPPMAYVAP